MGWSIGFDEHWQRDVGYGVPALCDHPGCNEVIDRGLSFVCGGAPYGGEDGCGLYFCAHHLFMGPPQLCEACTEGDGSTFTPTRDVPSGRFHKLNHWSWAPWREEEAARTARPALREGG